MRLQKWAGQVSAASPYLIPAGGAVEQINLTCVTPGQLSARAGMEEFPVEKVSAPILEMWGYQRSSEATETIFLFDGNGKIHAVDGKGAT